MAATINNSRPVIEQKSEQKQLQQPLTPDSSQQQDTIPPASVSSPNPTPVSPRSNEPLNSDTPSSNATSPNDIVAASNTDVIELAEEMYKEYLLTTGSYALNINGSLIQTVRNALDMKNVEQVLEAFKQVKIAIEFVMLDTVSRFTAQDTEYKKYLKTKHVTETSKNALGWQ